jgi:cellulose synthase/poly-beta-1,6-N-acetylglucosamine synthase-like glycosyltransferase
MGLTQIIFWACLAVVVYAYVGYPLVLWCVARLRPKRVRRAPFHGNVSVVLAARNEAGRVADRRDELMSLLGQSGLAGEVVIVSDGSTDGTAAAARDGADTRVRVIELTENVGKAQALSRGVAAASGDVIVFADARQRWAPDAIPVLLENFADPAVGGVSGSLVLEANRGVTDGVGFYWRYEKVIRNLEGRIHSTVGATGAISAVRRELFREIPRQTILDDVYWPMGVVMQGFRVIHDGRARAYDRLPEKAGDEFRRKVRTLSGNFQLVVRLPALLVPWKNPLWAQFVSHKLLRLAVPWLLLVLLAASALLHGPIYRLALAAQLAGYAVGFAGLNGRLAARSRLASAAGSFLVLNTAAWVAFWVWASGRAGSSWRKVVYRPPAAPNDSPTPPSVQAPTGGGGTLPGARVAARFAPTIAGLIVAILLAWAVVSPFLGKLFGQSPSESQPRQGGAAASTVPAARRDSTRSSHVDAPADFYVAPNGDDANAGAANAPFRTLQHAADVVRAGQTVCVRAGAYVGMNFHRESGGAPGHPICFLADPDVVINSSAKVGPNHNSGINLEPGTGWFIFSGFHVVNTDGSMERACIRVAGNSHTELLDNTCEKGGTWGIIIGNCDDVLIQGNLCANAAGEHGLYVGRGSKRVTVRNNVIRENNRDGFHLNGGADGPIDGALIEANVIFGNQLSGIDADGVQNSIFRNNLVYGNRKHAVSLYNNDTRSGCTNNLFVNNTFVAGGMCAIQMKPGSTANRMYNNILFQTLARSNYGSIGTSGAPVGLVSDYNIVVDRFSADLSESHAGLAQWRQLTGQERHSLVVAAADQLFVDASANDYRPRTGSPAVDAGTSMAKPQEPPPQDLLGKPRPRGKGFDIGAYEFQPKSN